MRSSRGVKTSRPLAPIHSNLVRCTGGGQVRLSSRLNPFHAGLCDSMLSPGIDDIDMFGMHLSNSSYAKARLFSCCPARINQFSK